MFSIFFSFFLFLYVEPVSGSRSFTIITRPIRAFWETALQATRPPHGPKHTRNMKVKYIAEVRKLEKYTTP